MQEPQQGLWVWIVVFAKFRRCSLDSIGVGWYLLADAFEVAFQRMSILRIWILCKSSRNLFWSIVTITLTGGYDLKWQSVSVVERIKGG